MLYDIPKTRKNKISLFEIVLVLISEKEASTKNKNTKKSIIIVT